MLKVIRTNCWLCGTENIALASLANYECKGCRSINWIHPAPKAKAVRSR